MLREKLYDFAILPGNMLFTINDRKLTTDRNSDGITDYYTADVVSYSDYYAFGASLPGRNASSSAYRYGFNGKEMETELHGNTGDAYDFGARIYDARLGRFLSTDPREGDYSWQSTYVFAANNPIGLIDINGEGPGEPPADQKVIKSPSGDYLNIDASANVELVTGTQGVTQNSKTPVSVASGSAKAFSVGASRYVALFNSKSGGFKGYYKDGIDKAENKYSPETILYEDKMPSGFKNKLLEISFELGHDPNKLATVMAHETIYSFRADIKNGLGAVGLIQFTGIAISQINRDFGLKITKADLAKMTSVQQLEYVKMYFQTSPVKNKTFNTIDDYAVATFTPAHVGKSGSNVIYRSGSKEYKQNSAFDSNNDGKITNSEVGADFRKLYVR